MLLYNYPVLIQGVTLDPQPLFDGGLKWSWNGVQTADSGRAEDGGMIITEVARKRKLEFKFPAMTPYQATDILSLIDPVFFQVTYYDLADGAYETRTFYKGDPSAEWYSFCMRHALSGMEFNVIEK